MTLSTLAALPTRVSTVRGMTRDSDTTSTDTPFVLSDLALGDMEPAIQALYENAHLKVRSGVPLLASERVALEERLDELWEEHGVAEGEVVLPPRCTLVLYLQAAGRAARADAGPQQALALLTWLIEAEECRAYIEHDPHARQWDDWGELGDDDV